MALRDPLYHPLFLGRRAAPETPPFEPFPPSGRKPWKGEPRPRRDLEFHVRHYKVTLEVDLERRELRGRAVLTVEAIRDGIREVALDAAELDVESVRAGGRRLRHESEGEKLRVVLPRPLPEGKRVTVEIAYSTRPRKGFFFVGPTEAEADRHVAGWSQGQADDTHWWIPCLESTESRATLEMIATVPQGYRAIGNGRLVSRRASARRKRVTYHWRQDTAHPAYLISLVVGKLVELRDRAGKIPVHGYVPRGNEAKGRELFKKTPFMIETFAKVFGYPYPYPKYAQSTVFDFTFGGMENTGATTLTVRALQTPEEAIDQTYETLISHELAHQWWGDLVTCRDWSEGWLNEGFATYSEIVFWEAEHGRDEADFARLEQMCSYLVEDYGDYRRPLVETRYRYPSDIFDRHLYEKGATVVHMLRSALGDAAWRRGLKRYLESHAFGGVETADLRRACEEVSGRNLAWFFDQWAHHGGHPEIKAAREWDPDSKSLLVTVEQVQEPDAVTPAVFRIPMVLELVVGERRLRLPIDIQQRRETIRIPLPARPRYVALDPEHDVMKLMEFPRSDEELLYGLAESSFALERIRCARELASRGDAGGDRGALPCRPDGPFLGRAGRGDFIAGRDRGAPPRAGQPDRRSGKGAEAARPARGGVGAGLDRRGRRGEDPAPYRGHGGEQVRRGHGPSRDRPREEGGRVRHPPRGAGARESPRPAAAAHIRRAGLAERPAGRPGSPRIHGVGVQERGARGGHEGTGQAGDPGRAGRGSPDRASPRSLVPGPRRRGPFPRKGQILPSRRGARRRAPR